MRLFIGLPLSDNAAQNTASLAQHAQILFPGRYVIKSNYHLTLAFLGEVPQTRLDDVKQLLVDFAKRFPAPCLTLGNLSYFRQPSNAILIRKAESSSDLAAMHHALVRALDAQSLPYTDGPFSPHVTLARHADLSCASLDMLNAPPVSFSSPNAILFLSARDQENILRYTPLHTADFMHR